MDRETTLRGLGPIKQYTIDKLGKMQDDLVDMLEGSPGDYFAPQLREIYDLVIKTKESVGRSP